MLLIILPNIVNYAIMINNSILFIRGSKEAVDVWLKAVMFGIDITNPPISESFFGVGVAKPLH